MKESKHFGSSASLHTEVKLTEKGDWNQFVGKVALLVFLILAALIGLATVALPDFRLSGENLGFFLGAYLFGLCGALSIFACVQEKRRVEEAKAFGVNVPARISSITASTVHTENGTRIRHEVMVCYSYNGIHYNDIVLGYYSSSMEEGQPIELMIDTRNPGEIISSGGYAAALIAAAISLIPTVVLLLIGLFAV